MKRTIRLAMLALALSAGCMNANAQFSGFLNKMKQKVTDKIKNKVDDKVTHTVDKVIDGAEEEVTHAIDGKKGEKERVTTGGNRTDFVPGEVVFFEDDFALEQVGEFPSKWELIDGSAEVATIKGEKALFMPNDAGKVTIRPLMKEKSYLNDEFTIEFDWWLQESEQSNSIRILFAEHADNHSYPDMDIELSTGLDGDSYVKYKSQGGEERESRFFINQYVKWKSWNHIAISFNQRALKLYFNGTRLSNIPNAQMGHAFLLNAPTWGGFHSDYRYFRNFRFAQGAVDLYEQKETDVDAISKSIRETGKFVTNNILFETGKATLLPESMVELLKVAEYMKSHPQSRFEVQGHTDNQGSDNINDRLSQQRAEAVVNALASLGVDSFNLKAVGKGSHVPVADNKTADGRALNRRVEFHDRTK